MTMPFPETPDDMPLVPKLADVERAAIERAIELCNGNIPHAAVILGVAPSTLYRKIQSWADKGN